MLIFFFIIVAIQTTELSISKACEKMEINPIYSGGSPLYDQIIDVQRLKSSPRGPQMKTDMDSRQYAELSAVGKSPNECSNKLADEYKLHSQVEKLLLVDHEELSYTM